MAESLTDEPVSQLPPDLKSKWLAALRSGHYKQGHDRLRTEDGMCCLGVLCDVIRPDGWERAGSDWRWRETPDGDSHIQYLPLSLRRRLGFDGEGNNSIEGQLATRNDGVAGHAKHSFAQIADYIEANL